MMDKTSLYRAVWRWHFYAGLIVLPILLWMAVTGAIYLYKPEVDAWLNRDVAQVVITGKPLPASKLIAQAEHISGAKVTQMTPPARSDDTWQMRVEAGDFRRTMFINPYNGALVEMQEPGGIMDTVRDLHSLAITGPVGNALVEIVAGWAILLVLSGFYLWWPRPGHKALALRGKPKGRLFWRDLHASTGALAGLVILFLALTGMPWTQTWGRGLQMVVAANDWGRPKMPEVPVPQHSKPALPWSLQEAGMPHAGVGNIGVDRALALADRSGLPRGYSLILPSGPGTSYLAVTQAIRAQDARAVFINPGDGRILKDMRYADFGPGAKAVEWGIATHEGRQYGEINRLIMLAGCIAVVLLAISAPVMWWKRRVDGHLRAPPAPDRPGSARGVAAIMLGIGVIFPLTGLSMLAAMLGERVVAQVRQRKRLSS